MQWLIFSKVLNWEMLPGTAVKCCVEVKIRFSTNSSVVLTRSRKAVFKDCGENIVSKLVLERK